MIKKNYSDLVEFTSAQLARLKKEYEPMRGKTISISNANKLSVMMNRLSKDMLVKLANADVPFVSTSAASKLVMKHGMKFTDFKLNMSEADELQCEACWTGYKQVGMKKKGDRMVPNCVKEDIQEADLKEFKKMIVTIKDPIKRANAIKDIQRFGKGTGFRIDKMSDGKSFRIDGKGADLNKFATDMKNFYGAEIKAESLEEADLSKSQVKMVHKTADKMPKKDFIKRYGKDGDAVRYATATNMVKKELGIEEQRVKNSPEVAAAIRQYIAQRPFIDNKRDYEELMRLAA